MRAGRPAPTAQHYVLTATIYVAAYVALDWVSFIHPFAQLAITPWNPPPGLSLFLLLRFGLRYVPVLFVATMAAELVVRGVPLHPLITLGSAVLLASGYSLVGAILAGPSALGDRLESLRDINRLVAAALIGPLVIALAYVGLHVALGALSVDDFARAATQFWIGDAIGIVVTTPLLLQCTARRRARAPRVDAEMLVQAGTVLVALWIVFGIEATDEFKFFYLLFLPLIWIAMTRGLQGAVVVSLGIQLGLIAAGDRLAVKGVELREIQFLMLTLALTALYLGMAVSERRAAQRELMVRDAALNRALRMATAGEIAAAVAHELNQPLSAIGTYVDACAQMLDKPTEPQLLRDTLDKVSDEVMRAGKVMRRLREFYTSGSVRRQRMDAAMILNGALESIAPRLLHARIRLDVTYAPELPMIEVDTIQMQAVLHNLVANAIDALSDSDAPDRHIAASAVVDATGMLAYTITDSGPGVSAEAATRLFEAFNTTKPSGMGLGLAISRSIVEAHGGRLTWKQTARRGATFEITLPLADNDDSHDA